MTKRRALSESVYGRKKRAKKGTRVIRYEGRARVFVGGVEIVDGRPDIAPVDPAIVEREIQQTLLAPPPANRPAAGYAIDLRVLSSRIVVRESEGFVKIIVAIVAPVPGKIDGIDLAYSRTIPAAEWYGMHQGNRDRLVFDVFLWLLRHELAERLTRDGVHVAQPHPTPSTAFPDVEVWTADL